jgi:predicted transcriptional regulator
MNKVTISASIPEKLGKEIDAIAEASQRPKDVLLTEALEDYVWRQSWLETRIDEAVRDADESGEYVSEEDMSAWLDTWGKPGTAAPPQLHKRDKPR